MIFNVVRLFLSFGLLVTVAACSKPAVRAPETGSAGVPPRSAAPAGKGESKVTRPEKADKMLSAKDRPYAVDGRWYFPLNSVQDYKEEGMASWYGPDFHGKRTSSGETYDMFGPTAAHRILPLNTKVRVRNPANKKEIIVRINDRGPFVKERIIDLSYDSAKALGLVGPGTAWVELEALGILMEEEGADGQKTTRLIQQVDYRRGSFLIQFGAFKEYQNALRLKEKLESEYRNVEIAEVTIKGDPLYRVRIKCSDQLSEALRLQKELEDKGYNQVLVLAQ